MIMKEHVLRVIALILVFLSYFAWRINMIGLELFLIPFVVLAIVALVIIIKRFCREPKDDKQRKQDRGIFIMVLTIFHPSSMVNVKGFSQYTSLPAFAAKAERTACHRSPVQIRIASISARSRISLWWRVVMQSVLP